MKKTGIIILIVFLSLLVMSFSNILFVAITKGNSGSFFDNFSSPERIKENIRKEENISIDGITQIDLDFDTSDLNIIFTEDNDIKVIQYSNAEVENNKYFVHNLSGSKLTIEEGKTRGFHIFYFGWKDNMSYDVYIPKKYEGSLKINSISGDMNITQDIKLNDLEIKTTSADIKIQGKVEANEVTLNSVSGKIELGETKTNKLIMKTISGRIEIDSAINQIEAKSTSGDINIRKIEGNVNIGTVSGGISSEDFKITEDSKVKTTSGTVKMYLNESSNCQIQTKSVSGSIHLPNERNIIGNAPYNQFDVKTVSGSIRLSK